MKRFTIISISLVFALFLSSCSIHLGLSKYLPGHTSSTPTKQKHAKATHTPPSPNATSAVVQVSITSVGFNPQTLIVAAGTKVVWTNTDTVPHAIVSDNKAVDSGNIAPGASFSFVFQRAGVYGYHSTDATPLAGVVTVQ